MYTKLSYTEYRCSDQTSPDKSCIMRKQIMGSSGEMHGFIQHRDLYMCYCWVYQRCRTDGMRDRKKLEINMSVK